MTKSQALREYHNLYEAGVVAYLDKTDFNISDWLTPEEWERMQELEKIFST